MSIETKQNLQQKRIWSSVLDLTKNINISRGSTNSLANNIGQGEALPLESNAATVMDYSRF